MDLSEYVHAIRLFPRGEIAELVATTTSFSKRSIMSIRELAAIGAIVFGASQSNASPTAIASLNEPSALPCGVAVQSRAPSGGLANSNAGRLTVALVQAFPDSQVAAVLRRPAGKSDADLVLIRADDATPRLVSTIACAAYRALGVRGTAPSVRVSIVFRRGQRLPTISSEDSTRASEFLEMLRHQPTRDTPGAGRVRRAELWLVASP